MLHRKTIRGGAGSAAVLAVLVVLVVCVSCSERPALDRGLFETEVCAAAVENVLASIPLETKRDARIAYLSFGDYVADGAAAEIVKRFESAELKFVDGSGFRDKVFADKRFIVDVTTPEELTPLMIQVRSIERNGAGGYQVEIGWAYKEMLSRKIYHVDESVSPHVVTVAEAKDVRNIPWELDAGPAAGKSRGEGKLLPAGSRER